MPNSNPRALLAAAQEALQRGDLATAATTANKLSQLDPDSELGPQLLGMVLAKAGLPAKAATALREASRRTPRKAQVQLQLAEVLEMTGELPAAIVATDRALQIRPTYEAAHNKRRSLHRKAGARMQAPLVTAIIPTTGAPVVRQAIESALQQTHAPLELLLVADGPDAARRLPEVAGKLLDHPRVRRLDLPYNTGADGFNGHRIYGAVAFLARGGWLALLDEDNWWSDDHVEALVDLVAEKDLEWAFSLRDVHADDGTFVAPDDCDSLGQWPSVVGRNVLDTSTTLVRTDIAVGLAHTWYRRYGDILSPDVAITSALLNQRKRYGWTGCSTLRYRLRGPVAGPAARRFISANAEMRRTVSGPLPWRQRGFNILT